MKLHFLYTHDNNTGYGRMGTQLAKEFTRQGVEVLEHLRQDEPPAPAAMWASLPSNAQGWWEGQHITLLTMWEADRLPESIREGLDNFAQIFVPSLQNLELYSQYHPAVTQVNLGVDPDLWCYRARQEPITSFRFLADGRGVRKGTDLAVEAFKAAFDRRHLDGPMPQLVLKGKGGKKVWVNQDTKYITSKLDEQAEVELYASAHCFLAPTRGEGWGLQPLQAIAQGLPTILTNAHGQAEFAHLGWPIEAKKTKADYRLFGDAGDWWEPDFDELVSEMRYIYDDYDRACAVAHVTSGVARMFTWAESARSLLGALRADLNGEFSPQVWTKPVVRKYPLIVRMDWRSEVAGEVFLFQRGKLYWERGEIKRMLFEGGALDPACLEMDDTGLLPEQVERIGAMSASHEACPTCGQTLNSKPLHEYEDAGESGL